MCRLRLPVALLALGALVVAGCSGGSTATDQPSTEAVPGVTDEEVRVGFIIVRGESTEAAFGFVRPEQGDREAQIEGLVDWVNANGGLGGRTMVAVTREMRTIDDSIATEGAICTGFTQDDEVFAVVVFGQFMETARPCYAQANTLMLDVTPVPRDQLEYEELAPYLWSPSFPSYEDYIRGLIEALNAGSFFTGARVGVVGVDRPVDHRMHENVLLPALEEAGAEIGSAHFLDTSDIGTINTGILAAIPEFKSEGVDRVVFLGGQRIAALFATAANGQDFDARLALTTLDAPQFLTDNPQLVAQRSLRGALGIGFHPAIDVTDDQAPFPSTDAERQCLEIFEIAGVTFETRGNARTAMFYCDGVRLLKAATDLVDGELSAASWSAAAEGVGEDFQSASGFGTSLEPGDRTALQGYRVLAIEEDCGCFRYQGDTQPFPTDPTS